MTEALASRAEAASGRRQDRRPLNLHQLVASGSERQSWDARQQARFSVLQHEGKPRWHCAVDARRKGAVRLVPPAPHPDPRGVVLPRRRSRVRSTARGKGVRGPHGQRPRCSHPARTARARRSRRSPTTRMARWCKWREASGWACVDHDRTNLRPARPAGDRRALRRVHHRPQRSQAPGDHARRERRALAASVDAGGQAQVVQREDGHQRVERGPRDIPRRTGSKGPLALRP